MANPVNPQQPSGEYNSPGQAYNGPGTYNGAPVLNQFDVNANEGLAVLQDNFGQTCLYTPAQGSVGSPKTITVIPASQEQQTVMIDRAGQTDNRMMVVLVSVYDLPVPQYGDQFKFTNIDTSGTWYMQAKGQVNGARWALLLVLPAHSEIAGDGARVLS
jgi:hypothetical protein